METRTILLIIAAVIVALGIVIFQYFYRTKKRGNLSVILSFLRFIALFGLFLLLINPKFTRQTYTLEKPNLILLSDNSSSVAKEKDVLSDVTNSLMANKSISDQFEVETYSFSNILKNSDSLSFSGRNTNITGALSSLYDIYANSNTAIVLLSDGNQTLGQDYAFYERDNKMPVFPVVLGDTTQYEDVRIDQVNANRYAFLKNKFPIEIYVAYNGERNITSNVSISIDGKQVHQERVNLSNQNNSKILNTLLEASSVGPKSIQVVVSQVDNERNTLNNKKNIAVEVIDEKTNVAIISDMLHPDIGALTKAIESNEQRSVSVLNPKVSAKELDDVDLFILYQPNASFNGVYDYIKKRNANSFTVCGTHTDWNFLSRVQTKYDFEDNGIVQEVSPQLNSGFTKYDISEISFQAYPPLNSDGGLVGSYGGLDVLMNMKIRGAEMRSPLMFVAQNNIQKEAFVFGENLWKWRMQSYREHQDFKNFDDFVGKLVLYLSDNKSKERLQLDYESIYEGSNSAKISASYFDEAFVFDSNANLSIKLKGTDDEVSKEIPMLLKGTYYEVNLAGLEAGKYNFTVTEKSENRSKSGSFTILDFDIEQQFASSEYKKLGLLANNTGGTLFFPSQIDSLIQFVKNDERFRPIQRGAENVVSLIDFRWLLGIITAALALEWFIRKYNGLI
ncbi:VWA domain-containing protein [Maribacter halichondriae]|uniref:VWA domain-containing protein n=1 Tax=Maribacter halichondriae TaxID=2980554 RepID=UPI002358120F|nr:VWA domain-containing protein [Maribacter sp. Hal144]